MKIALGSDHAGFELKEEVKKYLLEKNFEVKDFGCFDKNSVDYSDIAKVVCESVVTKQYYTGILVCGTGIGISIAANKIKGIRAACCSDAFSAKLSRQHNNSNVLCFGARVVGVGLAFMMLDEFLNTDFEKGRHETRVKKVHELENFIYK